MKKSLILILTMTLILVGCSGSNKSKIAKLIENRLYESYGQSFIVDEVEEVFDSFNDFKATLKSDDNVKISGTYNADADFLSDNYSYTFIAHEIEKIMNDEVQKVFPELTFMVAANSVVNPFSKRDIDYNKRYSLDEWFAFVNEAILLDDEFLSSYGSYTAFILLPKTVSNINHKAYRGAIEELFETKLSKLDYMFTFSVYTYRTEEEKNEILELTSTHTFDFNDFVYFREKYDNHDISTQRLDEELSFNYYNLGSFSDADKKGLVFKTYKID